MPGWYDIASLDSLQGRADSAGVAASAETSGAVIGAGIGAGAAMASRTRGGVKTASSRADWT